MARLESGGTPPEQPKPERSGFAYLQEEKKRLTTLRDNPTELADELAGLVLRSPITNNDWHEKKGVKAGVGEDLFTSVVLLAVDEAVHSPTGPATFIEKLTEHPDELQKRLIPAEKPERPNPLKPGPLIETISQRVKGIRDADPQARADMTTWVSTLQKRHTEQQAEVVKQKQERAHREKVDKEELLESPTIDDFFLKFGTWITKYELDQRDPTHVEITYHKYRDNQYEKAAEEIKERREARESRTISPLEQLPDSCSQIKIDLPPPVLSYETLDELFEDMGKYYTPESAEHAGVPQRILDKIIHHDAHQKRFDAIREAGKYGDGMATRYMSQPLNVYHAEDGKYKLRLVRPAEYETETRHIGWGQPSTEVFSEAVGKELDYPLGYYEAPVITYTANEPTNLADPRESIKQVETSLRPGDIAQHFAHIAHLPEEGKVALQEAIIDACGKETPWQEGIGFQVPLAYEHDGIQYYVEPQPKLRGYTYDGESDRMIISPAQAFDFHPEVSIRVLGGNPQELANMTSVIKTLEKQRQF